MTLAPYVISSSDSGSALGALNEVERKHCPSTFYLAGDCTLLRQGKRVSIVGSRDASERGLEAAFKLARALSRNGVIIVSGLAKGIDTQAHKGAILVSGRTIGVLGTPLDQFYPKENKSLQITIGTSHLLVSQFESGKPVKPGNFPMRNRTMALISDATVIVEAKERSGSLHQGWEALRLGRPLWILASAASNPELSWPKEMLKYGAKILAAENREELLGTLPTTTRDERADLTF